MRPQAALALLEEPLTDEEQILDAFVGGMAAGQTTPEMFARLHEAAVRDDRVANLGFAYERLPRDTRARLLPKQHQVELWLHAATFFADIFGDETAAVAHAERAVAIAPANMEAFQRLEQLLVSTQDGVKLAKACSTAAAHQRDPKEKLRLLRRAVELLEAFSGSSQQSIVLLQQILELDPSDRGAREALEQQYLATRRGRDLAKLLEETLSTKPPPPDDEADDIRLRLVGLYRGELRDPQKAAPHVEALLDRDPVSEQAIQAAEALLDHRALIGKLAPKLSNVYARLGRPEDEATTLTLELKTARPPRLTEVHRRLAVLRQEVLQDPAGALELLEPLIAKDPTDDELRRRYLDVSATFHRQVEAARLLTRSLSAVKDPSARAKIGLEIARLYVNEGESKRAQASVEQALHQAQDDETRLAAARLLIDMQDQVGDLGLLCRALENVVRLDPELSNRVPAAKRLAEIADQPKGDRAQAILAWKTLIHSPRADEALNRLEALSIELDDHEGLVEVLEQRAARASSSDEARSLAFRAAETRSQRLPDRQEALGAWRRYLSKYGPSRDVYARMIPLLEQTKDYRELADVLEKDVALADLSERARGLARLAQVRLSHLGDPKGALDAFKAALSADPRDKQSRRAVERMLAQPEHRVAAADVLEGVYLAEGNFEGVVKTLVARADAADAPKEQLRHLERAADHVARQLKDPRRGLDVAGRALSVAVSGVPGEVEIWLEHLEKFAVEAADPAARARLLSEALSDRAVESPQMSALARATGEALVAAGDAAGAIDAYRRALAFEPSSPELLSRIDELLREQGSPEERLSLYKNALEEPADPARRREVMHAIARIQHKDLGDTAEAVATWRRLIAENPGDQTAHSALVEAFEHLGDREALVAELQRGLEHIKGPRRVETRLKVAEILAQDGETARALDEYRSIMEDSELEPDALETIAELADTEGDAALVRRAAEKRAQAVTEPDEQVRAHERLGEVLSEYFDDHDGAMSHFLQAARVSRDTGTDVERTRRLFERVLALSPDHRESAEALLLLYVEQRAFSEAPAVFSVVLRSEGGFARAVELLFELSKPMREGGAIPQIVAMADEALGQQGSDATRRSRELMLLKANVLLDAPESHAEVASIYRGLVETHGRSEDADEFERFLARAASAESVLEHWRWLFGWRAEHAQDPSVVLVRWGEFEEAVAKDLGRAERVYSRVLEMDDGHVGALRALGRLRAARGDNEGLLKTLDRLAELEDSEESVAIDLQRANLLVGSLGAPKRALPLLRRVLERDPTNTEAVMIARVALDHPDVRDAAVELLDNVASSVDDPTLATNVLDALLRASVGIAPLREARARWYERLVGLREGEPEAALDVAVTGARELPESEGLWDRAERLSRRAKRPEVLADAYRDVLAKPLSPEVAESVGRRMVEFHEEWFDEPEVVLRMLERVLVLSPRARWALDRVKLALNAEGRWEDLFKLYDQAIAETPDAEERDDLLDEAALAAKDLANDPRRAIGYFERLAEARPRDPRIESTLERLYEREGSKKELIQLLERRLPGLEDRERPRLERRLGALWLDVGAVDPAFALAERLLDSRPDDSHAFKLLERILDEAPVELGRSRGRKGKKKPKTVVDRAFGLLEARYREAGRTADLVRVMLAQKRFLATQKEIVRRLGQVLALQKEIEDHDGAFDTVAELVRLEPKELSHRSNLDELAIRTGRSADQVQLLVEVADEAKDAKNELDLIRQAAAVAKERLAERGLAIELYQRLLKLSGSAPNMALTATRELDELLATAGRSRDRCAVLETMASVEQDPERKRQALAEVARIALDQLDEPDRARAAWQARLDDDPSDLDALDGIDPILVRLERYDTLATVLDRRASLTEGEEARRDRVRLARLLEERLLDRPRAIEQWRLVRSTFGEDEESFEALTALLEVEARWQELATLVAQTAESTESPELMRELYRRLGDIHRQHTGEPMLAIRAYLSAEDWESARAVAGSVAERELARDVMFGLLDLAIRHWQTQGGDPETPPARTAHFAIQSLVKRLLEEGASERVVELQLRGAALPFHRAERRQLSRDAAWTACDRLEDTERAIEILQELFNEDAGDEVAGASVARFARLLEEAGRDADLAGLWEQQARARSSVGDRPGAAALWARAADIWENRLGDTERAIAVHRQGAAIGGEASLESLARLYKAKDDYRTAAMALEWLCAQSSRESLAGRALELADVYVRLGERDRARARLEHAAATALDATGVRARLGELYRQSKSYHALAGLLVDEAALAEDANARLSRLVEAADIHLKKRNDPAAAIPILEQAVELDPDDSSLRLVLSQALAKDRRYDDAAAILKAQIERYGARKPKGRAQVHLNLARVCLAAGRRAEALGELDLASKIDPAHPAILYELSKLSLQENQLARAEKTFRALLLVLRKPESADDDMPGRAEVYLALSEIASRQGEAERATEFVESAFEAALDSPEEARALERALEAQGRYDLLARAVESRLAVASEPSVAAKALADLVVLHAERLGTSAEVAERVGPRADRIYDELAEDDELDQEAWGALSRVYEWLGKPDAEAKVLERRVKAILQGTPAEEDAEALYKLAAIRLSDPQATDEGVDLLSRALEVSPEFQRAEVLLTEAVQHAAGHEGLLRLMERVARRSGRETFLVEAVALAAGADFTTIGTIREGVELGLSLKERGKVIRMLENALGREGAFDRRDLAWMHRELARLRLLDGDARGAVVSLEKAAAVAEPDDEYAWLLEAAELALYDLGDLDKAAAIYTRMLEAHPSDRRVWEPLLDVYRRQGARSELIELIERTVPLVESLRDRNRLRLEEATLMLEESERRAEAEALLRDIISEDPALHEAAETLTAVYEREGNFEELAELVGTQLDIAKTNEDVEAVEAMSLKLAALLERQEKFDEALQVHRALLDWNAQSASALRAIVRLSEQLGSDDFELADSIEALLAVEQGDRVRALTERLIELRKKQGDEVALDRALDLGFSADPRSAELREQVVMRAISAGNHLRAARALRRAVDASNAPERPLLIRALAAYRDCGHFDEAISVVDEALEGSPGDAELLFERFRLLSGAGRSSDALGALRAAHEKGGGYQRELIEALEEAIARREAEDVPACTIELVDLLEGTGQTGQARHHLSQLLKEHPKHRDALRRLAWLASSEGRWEEASAAYRRLIPLEQGDALVSAAMNLADACERGDRLADARGGLERAIAVVPDNADLRKRLRELYEATGAHRELAHLLLQEAAKETKVSAKAEQLIFAAELLLEKNRAADEAVKVLEEVQGLMPESIQAAVLLGRAHVQMGQSDRAMTALTGVVGAYRGRRIRELSQVYQEMANIHLEEGDLSAALETLSRAFDMDMRNGALATQLGYLALDLDDQDIAQRAFRAVTMMRVRSESSGEGVTSEGKAVAYYHLSRIAQAQGDVRKARLMASKAVSENPNHEDAQALLEELRAS